MLSTNLFNSFKKIVKLLTVITVCLFSLKNELDIFYLFFNLFPEFESKLFLLFCFKNCLKQFSKKSIPISEQIYKTLQGQ
jgi:hypothetical protein